jgi:hypothetical protein
MYETLGFVRVDSLTETNDIADTMNILRRLLPSVLWMRAVKKFQALLD